MSEVRGEKERDSAFGVQRDEWVEQRRFGQIVWWLLWRWGKLLRRRLRLQLSQLPLLRADLKALPRSSGKSSPNFSLIRLLIMLRSHLC